MDPSVSCLIIPAPSLLAEPSSPSARYARSGEMGVSDTEMVFWLTCDTWLFQRRPAYASRHANDFKFCRQTRDIGDRFVKIPVKHKF